MADKGLSKWAKRPKTDNIGALRDKARDATLKAMKGAGNASNPDNRVAADAHTAAWDDGSTHHKFNATTGRLEFPKSYGQKSPPSYVEASGAGVGSLEGAASAKEYATEKSGAASKASDKANQWNAHLTGQTVLSDKELGQASKDHADAAKAHRLAEAAHKDIGDRKTASEHAAKAKDHAASSERLRDEHGRFAAK